MASTRRFQDNRRGWLKIVGERPPRRSFALEWGESDCKWKLRDYSAGLAGYGAWIAALEDETADGFGTAYNAQVWAECRRNAAAFLREAKERLGEADAAFDEAIDLYDTVAQNLAEVAKTFPFIGLKEETFKVNIADASRRATAVGHLRVARKAEQGGLERLERLLSSL